MWEHIWIWGRARIWHSYHNISYRFAAHYIPSLEFYFSSLEQRQVVNSWISEKVQWPLLWLATKLQDSLRNGANVPFNFRTSARILRGPRFNRLSGILFQPDVPYCSKCTLFRILGAYAPILITPPASNRNHERADPPLTLLPPSMLHRLDLRRITSGHYPG